MRAESAESGQLWWLVRAAWLVLLGAAFAAIRSAAYSQDGALTGARAPEVRVKVAVLQTGSAVEQLIAGLEPGAAAWSGSSTLVSQALKQAHAQALETPRAPRPPREELVRDALIRTPQLLREGLSLRLRGEGLSDPKEVVVAVYAACPPERAQPCVAGHSVVVSKSHRPLFDWALEGQHGAGARLMLPSDERALIEAQGGEGWHLMRFRIASDAELAP